MPPTLEDLALTGIERPFHATEAVRVEPSPRRVRGLLEHETVVDSRRVALLFETGHLPVYYFPLEDLHTDLLVPSARRTVCPRKGEAGYHSIRVGDRIAKEAVWRYEHPIAGCPDISGHVGIYWKAMDSWWEEDDQVFVHARDPYKRVDVLRSSRHVRVDVDGETVAESRRPLLLFETGLPTRYYLPRADVRLERLRPSGTVTACPYKGTATYFDVVLADRVHADLAWSYPTPIPECAKVEQAICFHNEHVDLHVDGELQERPRTPWS
jgi:uncharacterized protein (DUF427 family)